MKKIFFPALRLLLGGLFAFSGFAKLVEPYQNFLAVVDSYQIVHGAPAAFLAKSLPWLEFLAGVFLVLGLWSVWAARVLWAMITVFFGVVLSAILRGLPLKDCGCFGEGFSLSPQKTLLADLAIWGLFAILFLFRRESFVLSFDAFFNIHNKKEKKPR